MNEDFGEDSMLVTRPMHSRHKLPMEMRMEWKEHKVYSIVSSLILWLDSVKNRLIWKTFLFQLIISARDSGHF